VIPPKRNAEFVAAMERVLDLYHLPYDPKVPVIVMDEQPVQLFKETRTPIPATRNHAKRVDDEYDRAGVANLFMFAEPLGCWRRVSVRGRKTKIDWAYEVRILLEEDYPNVQKVVLVNDNLSTHSLGALYEAFEPEVARALARRLEIIPTPKHGSWLNIAENELSALTRQCVKGCRFATIEELQEAVQAWMKQTLYDVIVHFFAGVCWREHGC
jgi:hypothetical protein